MQVVDKEQEAIDFIIETCKTLGGEFYAGNSGGKDSAVVDHLLQRSGVPYKSFYANTTIDPPETIPHLRKYYPHTELLKPKETFLQLTERKGLPTRLARFCCEILKEYGSVGKQVFEGVRSAESTARQGRSKVYPDTRASQNGAIHIYPIYDWSDNDVWEYIEKYGIIVNPAYGRGLKRIGCVACPLVKKSVREDEFGLYPKFYGNIKNAIKRGMDNNPQWKLTLATNGDPDIAMKWWMSRKTIDEYFIYHDFQKVDGVWRKTKKPTLF